MSDADEEDLKLIEAQVQWSWPKFWIGWAKLIMDRALWVWSLFTYVGISILRTGSSEGNTKENIVISGWIGVTVIYLLGNHFKRGIEQMLNNSKADLRIGVGK